MMPHQGVLNIVCISQKKKKTLLPYAHLQKQKTLNAYKRLNTEALKLLPDGTWKTLVGVVVEAL